MKRVFSIVLVLAMLTAVFAGCTDANSGQSALDAAKDYIYAMYKDGSEVTAADYQVIGVVAIDGVQYDIEWTVEYKSGPNDTVKVNPAEKGVVNIDITEKNNEDVVYVLTATVKDKDGKTASVSFNRKIPAYKETGWADYFKAAAGDSVIVGGVVTAVISKSNGASNNCLYIQDATEGGYYVYGMTDDPAKDLGIEVGMTVKVVGTKDIYNGTHEVKDASVEITDKTKKDVTPVDMTEAYTKAATLKDEALAGKQGMLVTVKGVEITGQDTASGYYKFKLGDKESYVRISSSVCPIVAADQETLKKGHSEHLGYTANVTGVICVYDGAFYLTPVSADAFEYLSLPELDDKGKVDFELNGLELTASVINDTELELPAKGKTYEDVELTWTSDNACAVVKDGKLVVTLPKEETKVTVTATAKSGDATATKKFEITVSAAATGEVASYGHQNTLKNGDKVIIYNPGSGMALSELDYTGNPSYRAGEAVSVNAGVIKTNLSRLVWEVKAVNGGFQFVNDAGQTLSATGRKLSIADTDNVWAIKTASTKHCVYLESTTGKGDSGDPYTIEWYAKYTEFSSFYYKEADEGLFAMQLFVLGATPVSAEKPVIPTQPEQPEDKPVDKPTVDPSTGDTYTLTTSLKNGDRVVIYNPESGMALSEENVAEDKTSYRKGVQVTVSGNTLKTATTTLVWEVKAVDGGFQFVNDAGQTLSATGKRLPIGGDDAVWTVGAAKTANCVYITSTTVKGDKDFASLEWYEAQKDFSTHYYGEKYEGAYAMQLFVLG